MFNITYLSKASSPDELALINFARFAGFTYQGINENNEMLVHNNHNNRIKRYKLLQVFEFNSARLFF